MLLKGTAGSAKGAADGTAAIAAPTVASVQAKIPNDIARLVLTTTRLAKLTGDSSTATVDGDAQFAAAFCALQSRLASDVAQVGF